MADFRVITILPPQPIQGITQPHNIAGNQAGQTTTVSHLQVGSILSGFIINRDNSGNPILRTEKGDIAFASNFFLKIGSEITIRIENSAGNNLAHILTVNGQPPEIAVQQSSFAQEPEVIVSKNLRQATQFSPTQTGENKLAETPVIIVKGNIITAPANSTSPLPNDTQLTLKVINIEPAASNSNPTQTSNVDAGATAKQSVNLTNSPLPTPPANQQATTSAPTPMPYAAYARFVHTTPTINETTTDTATGNKIAVSSTLPQPSQIPTPVTTQNTNTSQEAPLQQPKAIQPQIGQQIIASIISSEPNGESIAQTPIGLIRLQTQTVMPTNSHITFEISEITTPDILENENNVAMAGTNTTTSPAPLTQLARNPSAFGNIFSLLSGLGRSEALNFIEKNIPTIGLSANSTNIHEQNSAHNIISPLFSFIAAVKEGDFRAWLGRANVRWLENNGHENLLKKAEGEFLNIAKQFVEAPAQQWQSLFFPIAVDGELQQLRLFVKRDRKHKEQDEKKTREEDTRFVLEMELSQLGEMQMDGFVRRSTDTENVQFDLIIRSYTELSSDIQKDILNIYNDMGRLTGYNGSVGFQAVKDFPVNPMEDILAMNGEHKGIEV